MGLGAGAAGAWRAGNERDKQRRLMERELDANTRWYNENALQDYTQRADVQALIRDMRENLYRNNRISANAAAVTGATPEQQAVMQQQANKAMSDVYSNIGRYGQQWKDGVTNRYFNRRDAYTNGRLGMLEANAASYENLMNSGFGSAAGSLSEYLGGVL